MSKYPQVTSKSNLQVIALKTHSTNLGLVRKRNARHDRNLSVNASDRKYTGKKLEIQLWKTKRGVQNGKGQQVRNVDATESMIN